MGKSIVSRPGGPLHNHGITVILDRIVVYNDHDKYGFGEINVKCYVKDNYDIKPKMTKTKEKELGASYIDSWPPWKLKYKRKAVYNKEIWKADHVGDTLFITIDAYDDDSFIFGEAKDFLDPSRQLILEIKSDSPFQKFIGTHEVPPMGEVPSIKGDWQIWIRIEHYPSLVVPKASDIAKSISENIKNYIEEPKEEVVVKIMKSERFNVFSREIVEKVRPIVSNRVCEAIYPLFSKGIDRILEYENISDIDAEKIIKDTLKTLSIGEETLEEEELKRAINNESLRGIAREIEKELNSEMAFEEARALIDEMPISDMGKGFAIRGVKKTLKSKISSLRKKIVAENENGESTDLDINEFYIKMRKLMKVVIEKFQKTVGKMVVDKAKLAMFQWPEEAIDVKVINMMLYLLNNISDDSEEKSGLFESELDDEVLNIEKGYGIRKKLAQAIWAKRPFFNIREIACRWKPSRGGVIPGLGIDIFFDVAMEAHKRIDELENRL